MEFGSLLFSFPFFSFFKVLHVPQILTQMPIPPEIISDSLKSGNCSVTLRIVCGIYCTNFWFSVHMVLCTDPTWASNTGLVSCTVSVSPEMILSVCTIVTWNYRLHNSRNKLFSHYSTYISHCLKHSWSSVNIFEQVNEQIGLIYRAGWLQKNYVLHFLLSSLLREEGRLHFSPPGIFGLLTLDFSLSTELFHFGDGGKQASADPSGEIKAIKKTCVMCVYMCVFKAIKLIRSNFAKKKESEFSQSCLTLCDSMDCSLPGSSVHGIFQPRMLEWIAISFSRGSS